MPSQVRNYLAKLVSLSLAKDEGARVLQKAGILRFVLILVQGVVLVKAGVPIEVIGQVEFVFFAANFMMFYWQNGGRNALLSWVPGEDARERNLRFGAVFTTFHLYALVAALAMILISGLPWLDHYSFLQSRTNVMWLAAYIFFTLPTVPLIFSYLIRGLYSRIIWYISLSYVVQISIVLISVVGGFGVEKMMMFLALYGMARWAFALFDGRWFENGMPSWGRMATYCVFSIPLIFHALNSGLMDYIDGWLVSFYFGEDQFALYRYGAKELPINTLLISGLLTGLIPKYREKDAVDHADLKSEIARLMRVLFPISCLLILISAPLYRIVFSPEFEVSARIFNIYALTLVSRVLINQVYLYVFHHNWVLSISTAVEIAINIGLSIILMQSIGLLGIPLATVIAFAIHKVFLLAYIRIYMQVPIVHYVPVKNYVLYLLLIVGCFTVAELIYF